MWYIMGGRIKRAHLIWSLALLCDPHHSCGESYSKKVKKQRNAAACQFLLVRTLTFSFVQLNLRNMADDDASETTQNFVPGIKRLHHQKILKS